jgi:hypothetical protein
VVDFVVVTGAEVADLFVSETQSKDARALSSIEVMQGTPVSLFVRPAGKDTQTLAGAFDYSWSVADEGIATLMVSSDSSAEVTLMPQGGGSTDLTVSAGGLEVTFYLNVEGGAMP